MSSRHTCVVVLSVVCLVACAAPAPPPAAPAIDLAAEERAVRDASAAWLLASQTKDAVAIDGFFTANISTIYDGKVIEGLPAVQENRQKDWAKDPDFTVVWTASEIGVAASGDLAYERGNWTSDPDGAGEKAEERGEYLTVWKKSDGQWKVLHDAGSTIKPEEEAATGG